MPDGCGLVPPAPRLFTPLPTARDNGGYE